MMYKKIHNKYKHKWTLTPIHAITALLLQLFCYCNINPATWKDYFHKKIFYFALPYSIKIQFSTLPPSQTVRSAKRFRYKRRNKASPFAKHLLNGRIASAPHPLSFALLRLYLFISILTLAPCLPLKRLVLPPAPIHPAYWNKKKLRSKHRKLFSTGGSVCELNTPDAGSLRHTGFEVRAGHQTESAPMTNTVNYYTIVAW